MRSQNLCAGGILARTHFVRSSQHCHKQAVNRYKSPFPRLLYGIFRTFSRTACYLTVPTRSRIVTKSVARSAERHARGGVLVGAKRGIILGKLGHSRLGRNVAVLALGAGLLIAVGGPAAGSLAAASHAQAARTASASGGTFVVADTSSVQKLDPDVVTNFLDFQALGLIYDQLVQYNRQLKIVPDLATNWTFSDGNRVITFQLRQGVKFDDGTTFNSANVVASLQAGARPEDGRRLGVLPRHVKNIVAVGPYAVKFDLSTPDSSILDGLTSVNLSMLSTKAIAAGTLATTPDGTGPFEFSSWSPDNYLRDQGQPELLGRQGDSGVGQDRDDSRRAVDRLGPPGEHRATRPVDRAAGGERPCPRSRCKRSLTSPTGPSCSRTRPGRSPTFTTGWPSRVPSTARTCSTRVFGQGKVVGPVPLGPVRLEPRLRDLPHTEHRQGQDLPEGGRRPERILLHRPSPQPTSTRPVPPRRRSSKSIWLRPGSR